MQKIVDFNLQQLEHISLVQTLANGFCCQLMQEAIGHDTSKFELREYEAFVNSRESLNNSKTGNDVEYQKHLGSDAIQHHINSNRHHPEYWDKIGEEMPLAQIILMFFDWYSRSLQRKTSFNDFWEFNTAKLKRQPKALVVVESLKNEMEKTEKELARNCR